MYAVVDIETTGGNATYGKIIEIAIVVFDGLQVVEKFSSLVNPQRPIPPFITSLTGISSKIVANAPVFEEIAERVQALTENKVFVAHNVNFDYSFVKKEFSLLGLDYNRKKLCTVRLARKLVPQAKRFNLGSICGYLGIEIKDRHRALGDAEATVQLLSALLQRDPAQETIRQSLKRNSKEMSLPPHISRAAYDSLPAKQGVYFFHDQRGEIIYVGKAINIKERVSQHFTGNTHSKKKGMFASLIHSVTYQLTGNELISLLLENEAIKKHYPRYNKTNKSFLLNFGIYRYIDQKGFIRLVIGKAGKHDKPISTFSTEAEAVLFLMELVSQHGLCLRLSGLIKTHEKCNYEAHFGQQCPVCQCDIEHQEYNERVEKAMRGIGWQHTFLIKTAGRKVDEDGFVMVEKGRFIGYGFVQNDMSVLSIEDFKDHLQPCYDTQDSQSIIKSFLKKSVLVLQQPVQMYQLHNNMVSEGF
jgi:DNA polymerase-3 subunit epsilon